MSKNKNEEYYSGEIYFGEHNKSDLSRKKDDPPEPPVKRTPNKQDQKKAMIIYIAGLALTVALCSFLILSCLNDIFAFNKSTDDVTVIIPEKASTGQVIKILSKNNLISHKVFCRAFINLTLSLKDKDPEYLSGVYNLKASMGVEKMLLQCQQTQVTETVSLTFPEGYTVGQIAAKLEKYDVCSTTDFYKNLDSATFDYDFLNKIENKDSRYRWLEGYLYPDTYEFYVGESASSVIRKMLDNFDDKWTDAYQKRADELGLTCDQVMALASIIQGEAGSVEQMSQISSVLHNRLNNSVNYPYLQCDCTIVYLNKYIKENIEDYEYDSYQNKYSTYYCTGLPIGAINNPGASAIKAALYPADTDYYYFCHDSKGEIYLAKTEAQHNQNVYKAITSQE